MQKKGNNERRDLEHNLSPAVQSLRSDWPTWGGHNFSNQFLKDSNKSLTSTQITNQEPIR